MAQTKTKSPNRPTDQLKGELEQYFQACSQACDFNGAVLVGYQGEVLFSGASGYANKERDVLNTTKSKFRLASVTKPITAVAILQLQEKGKLKVTDPISKHLKWAPAQWKKITIHHLLTHTSGIPTYADSPTYNRARHIDPDELVEQVVMYPLEFEPGTKFNYSDSNYFLLGILILTKAVKVYKTYLKENIFDPVGMKDTGVDENLQTLPNRAMGYARDCEGALTDAAYTLVSNEYATGDLYSTVEDLFLLDRALSNGKLLSSKSMQAILKPNQDKYAYGWQV